MQTLSTKLTTLCLTAACLALAATGAPAQQARMAEAAHKGTFNFLRTAPDRHSHILQKMPQGTRFEVVGASGDYDAVVLADGTRGWTFKTNVRFL